MKPVRKTTGAARRQRIRATLRAALGEWLHPAWVTDQFLRLGTEAGLPPIRLHDPRHGADWLLFFRA
jgi:hypothetical protein